jgi:hypothetical protein
MKSPFPGMDPYIESRGLWGDFHHHLINEIKCALAGAVSPRYVVRTGERSYLVLVEAEDKESHPFKPDVAITSPENGPLNLRAFIAEEHRETFVEIYEADPGLRLVTTIEILSPSNKRPGTEGWEQYQRKRQSVLLGGINFVEIDLLRNGQRPPMLDPWPDTPYTLLVARARKYQLCKVWPAHFRRPLPAIPVPLTKPDADISINLQPMIAAIYERSRYARSIDYRKPLTPPLSGEETDWLTERLRERQEQG